MAKRAPLRSKPAAEIPLHRLPFVGSRRADGDALFWAVPASGGYRGGYETGQALALAFLKHLRATPEEALLPMSLAWIAQGQAVRFEAAGGAAMLARPVDERGEGFASLDGQALGFFNTLMPWLTAAARTLGRSLDRIDEGELLAQANAGLSGESVGR